MSEIGKSNCLRGRGRIAYVVFGPFLTAAGLLLAAQPVPHDRKPIDRPTESLPTHELIKIARNALSARLMGELEAPWPSEIGSMRSLLFQAAAMAATGSRSEREPGLERFLDRLVSAQGHDGLFFEQRNDISLTWLARAVLSSSDNEAHRAAADRALTAIQRHYMSRRASEPSRRQDKTTSVARGMAFLRAHQGDHDIPEHAGVARGDIEPSNFAGGLLSRRRARALIMEKYETGDLISAYSLPDLGALQNLHLSARVLASYRSPRITLLDGRTRVWPLEFKRFLMQRWEPSKSEASPVDGDTTAAALLLLDVLEPWSAIVSQDVLAAVADDEPDRYAVLEGDCVDCHRRLNPGLVHQWEASPHYSAERVVGCAKCHGTNHSLIFRDNGRVSPQVCGRCHEVAWQEFEGSPHAKAEQSLIKSRLFAVTPEARRYACHGCHEIGRPNLDGTEGSCNYCHPGHRFMAADAIEPEACTGCHTGDDYPQDLAYWASKHGALYRKTRDVEVAPTCATCHHPGGTHRGGVGISIGGVGVGGILSEQSPAPIPMREISIEEFSEARSTMVEICTHCHSSRFAEEELRQADHLKAHGTALLAEAVEILRELHRDGFIDSPAGPGSELELGGEQVRVSEKIRGAALLNRFYEMWRFKYNTTWKGAYHSSPSVANLKSRSGPTADLDWIRQEAYRLRQEKEGSR